MSKAKIHENFQRKSARSAGDNSAILVAIIALTCLSVPGTGQGPVVSQDIAVTQNPSTGLSDIEFWTTAGNRAFLFRKSATGLSFGTDTNTVPSLKSTRRNSFNP